MKQKADVSSNSPSFSFDDLELTAKLNTIVNEDKMQSLFSITGYYLPYLAFSSLARPAFMNLMKIK
jgi:hypothetical protein